MKFTFDGPMCFVTELKDNRPKVSILVPRLVKEGGDFRMNLSDPTDEIQWVTIFIKKRNTSNDAWEVKHIDIVCDTYEEVISLVDALQLRYGELVKQSIIERKKPWLRVRRQQEEAQRKENKCENSINKSE